MNSVSTEVLNKAYRLAYFLHQDKGTAIRIVAAATLKLDVAMAAQSKRLYYVPVGRFSHGDLRRTDGIRNKALFSDLHLLQRLVYGESEPYERQKEQAAQARLPGVRTDGDPANEDDFLVYFIKHLVRITTKRNAFYVTLGVSRLLHNYSTLETMEIYNAVIGEPERVKDDYYYRSRKAVLMQEMYQRFGQLIRACRQRRGEERFETQPSSNEQRSLVRECLRLFAPWDTQCPVPRDFDPFQTVIARLTSTSSDDENKVEVNRIHAILHPDCFGKLVTAFGYSPPEERMELPRFYSNQSDDQSPPRQRRAPADLSAEELAEINHLLGEQAGRRRRSSSAALIRIIVDGVERATLNPVERSSISFSAPEDAEAIEVKTTDASGDLLLALHLLTSYGEDAQDKVSIRLEGGQKLSLSITRRPIEANGAAELLVEFGYRETDLRRVAGLWWQRLRHRFSSEQHQLGSGSLRDESSLWARLPARRILAASLAVAVISIVSYLGYVRLRSPLTTNSEQLSSAQATPRQQDRPIPEGHGAEATIPRSNETPAPKPNENNDRPNRAQPSQLQANKSNSPQNPGAVDRSSNESVSERASEEDASELTRSGVQVPNLKLSEVKKIYIEMSGAAASDELRRNLVASFGSNEVTATLNADEADSSLKIVVSQRGSEIEALARLVNARGVVLWPKSGQGTHRYSGETTKVFTNVVRDLRAEIRR